MPRAIAVAASGEPSDPLKGLGAATNRVGLVNGEGPVGILRIVAPDGAEVDALELARQLADAALADRPAIDLDDGRDLRAGAAHEQLVTGVELGAVDRAIEHLLAQLAPGDAPPHA